MERRPILDLKFGLNCGWERVKEWNCFHRHDEIEFLFFPKGDNILYRFGGKVVEIQHDQSILFWGAIPHQLVEISEDNVQYWLTIPPTTFLQWNFPSYLVKDVLDGKMIVEIDKELRDIDLMTFPIWKDEASQANLEKKKALNLSVEARIRRLALRYGEPLEESQSKPRYLIPKEKNAFLDMYDFITVNYKKSLRIKEIAKVANLHTNYAISLFKSKCGVNIVELITMLRVYEAQRLLLTTDLKIVDIAMESGFGSLSNFYKMFTKLCHKNPNDYRRSLQS